MLACALLLMLAAMVIGVAVARAAFASLASARSERDRITAHMAAEAALRDAEREIGGADRAAQFGPAGAGAFVDGCGRGPADLGLCRAASPPVWQAVDLAEDDSPVLVPYGRFTGASMPVGSGILSARLPAYLIERIEPAGAAAEQATFYRITAIGFGSRASTQVVLQSLYRKPLPAQPPGNGPPDAGDNGAPGGGEGGSPGGGTPEGGGDGPDGGAGNGSGNGNGNSGPGPPTHGQQPPLPAGRIGWREIANWPELHARAQE